MLQQQAVVPRNLNCNKLLLETLLFYHCFQPHAQHMALRGQSLLLYS
jgi:hypothetical protein